MIKNNNYKEFHPNETLKNIRSILNGLGIQVYEKSWYNYKDYCYSVRIQADEFNNVGMNGKGVSRVYALASAYGEFMERLQNRNLFFRKYGLKPDKNSFPDEVTFDSNEFYAKTKHLEELILGFPNDDIKSLIEDEPSTRSCAPFKDLIDNVIEYLPSKFIAFACGTNGMCAGNSEAEALIHGICEIFERYVSKKIVLEKLLLPEIPFTEVKSEKLLHALKYLKKLNYTIKIKDCTLGGKYPVIGLLVMNKDKTKFQLKLGSDPIFEIALERCLTEIFQGFDLNNFQKGLLPVVWDNSNSNIYTDIEMICKDGGKAFPDCVTL